MNAQSKKLTQLAAAVLMAMAVGNAYAAGYDVTIEGSGKGNNTNLNIQGSGNNNSTVMIDQINPGDGTELERNYVGTEADKLNITGNATKAVKIGQGAYYDTGSNAFVTAGSGAKKNLVKGTITSGTVSINQTSDGNTVNLTGGGVSGGGTVTVNQGYQNPAGGGGKGYTATITQSGAGTITLNQGNASDDKSTSGAATIVQAGAGTLNITQGNLAAASAGNIYANTTGGGTLNLTTKNTGTVYINGDGAANSTTATIDDVKQGVDSTIVSNMTGTLQLKNAKGEVDANVAGAGTVTINSNGGSGNKLYVNNAGTAANTDELTVAGTLTVTQSATSDNSMLAVKAGGDNVTGAVSITQGGSYQDATFTSTNGSSGTYTLNENGADGGRATINVTF